MSRFVEAEWPHPVQQGLVAAAICLAGMLMAAFYIVVHDAVDRASTSRRAVVGVVRSATTMPLDEARAAVGSDIRLARRALDGEARALQASALPR